MARFELTICSEYIADWNSWEGVRELIQNAIDGASDGFPANFSHKPQTNLLEITNRGAKLERSIWLMGKTTKTSDTHIGFYGEGLKLGILALLRRGHSVTIINDDETWTPALESSEAFPGETVLAVRTRKRPSSSGEFRVTISNITHDDWENAKSRFLLFDEKHRMAVDAKELPSHNNSQALLDPRHKGNIYVKGIWVQHDPKLAYGYALNGTTVDRDRKMVAPWELYSKTASIWSSALLDERHRPIAIEAIEGRAKDVQDVQYHLSKAEANEIVSHFRATHGDDAWPCRNQSEADRLEHYGYRGIVVNDIYYLCLEKGGLAFEKAQEAGRTTVVTSHDLDSLLPAQRRNLHCVQALFQEQLPHVALGNLDLRAVTRIVDFASPDVLGQFARKPDLSIEIRLARKILNDRRQLIQVFAHEIAHAHGGDGQMMHERVEGMLLAGVIDQQLELVAA